MRCVVAYLRLTPEVALRLLRCDVLAVGYIGQFDVLVLGPVARVLGRPILFNPLVTLTDTIVEDRRLLATGSFGARVVELVDRLALELADVVLVDTEETAPCSPSASQLRRKARRRAGRGRRAGVLSRSCAGHTSSGLTCCSSASSSRCTESRRLSKRRHHWRTRPAGDDRTGWDRPDVPDDARVGAAARDRREYTHLDRLDPLELLGDRLRRADVALGIFDAGPKAGRVVPNKVYQSLACGVATITRTSPASERLLRDGESALLIPPGDAAGASRWNRSTARSRMCARVSRPAGSRRIARRRRKRRWRGHSSRPWQS